MQTIGERINIILKNAGKKQKDLIEILSATSASVSNMCNGKTRPSNQSMVIICKEFGINREWLETGEGEMYSHVSDNERIAEYLGELLRGSIETDIRLRFISCLSKLGPEEWDVLYRLAKEWTEEPQKDDEGQA